MKILLDTANDKIIEEYIKSYPIMGVTTNPTILANDCKESGENPVQRLRRIKYMLGKERQLHVQLTENTYEKMVEEAYSIVRVIGEDTFVKVPVSEVGLKVIKKLSGDGINVTATAILTATQALLAAEAGAKYVAPYVSRLENVMANGIETIADIAQVFASGGYSTQILAASFKTGKEVLDTALAGAELATVSPEVLKMLVSHPVTNSSIEKFGNDWNETFGKTLYELTKEFKSDTRPTIFFKDYVE